MSYLYPPPPHFGLHATTRPPASIAGLPSKAREELVEKFDSVEGARVAGEAELRRIPGIGPVLAKRILAA